MWVQLTPIGDRPVSSWSTHTELSTRLVLLRLYADIRPTNPFLQGPKVFNINRSIRHVAHDWISGSHLPAPSSLCAVHQGQYFCGPGYFIFHFDVLNLDIYCRSEVSILRASDDHVRILTINFAPSLHFYYQLLGYVNRRANRSSVTWCYHNGCGFHSTFKPEATVLTSHPSIDSTALVCHRARAQDCYFRGARIVCCSIFHRNSTYLTLSMSVCWRPVLVHRFYYPPCAISRFRFWFSHRSETHRHVGTCMLVIHCSTILTEHTYSIWTHRYHLVVRASSTVLEDSCSHSISWSVQSRSSFVHHGPPFHCTCDLEKYICIHATYCRVWSAEKYPRLVTQRWCVVLLPGHVKLISMHPQGQCTSGRDPRNRVPTHDWSRLTGLCLLLRLQILSQRSLMYFHYYRFSLAFCWFWCSVGGLSRRP